MMIPLDALADPTGAKFRIVNSDGAVLTSGGFRAGMTEAEIMGVMPVVLANQGASLSQVEWVPPAPAETLISSGPAPTMRSAAGYAVALPAPTTPAGVPVVAAATPNGFQPPVDTAIPTPPIVTASPVPVITAPPVPLLSPVTGMARPVAASMPTAGVPSATAEAVPSWWEGSTELLGRQVPNKFLAAGVVVAALMFFGNGRSRRF